MTIGTSSRHLKTLDGFRGLAAMAVMLYHASSFKPGTHWLPGAFLAVDFFFLLSGFVVARAYETRLRSGQMTLGDFVRVRVIRLAPLYFAACCVGLGYFLAKILLGMADAPTIGQIISALPGTLALLPQPWASSWGMTDYPFAPSAWSLALELWFGILWAMVCPRLPSWMLIGMLSGAFLLLVAQAGVLSTLDLGYDLRTLSGGSARFWFSFTLGTIICRHGERLIPRRPVTLIWLLPVIGFVAVPHNAVALGLAWIALVFPLGLVLGAAARPNPLLAAVMDHLGRMSYAIYILHAPLLLWTAAVLKTIRHDAWNANMAFFAAAGVGVTLIVSAMATYLLDEPLRARLRARATVTADPTAQPLPADRANAAIRLPG